MRYVLSLLFVVALILAMVSSSARSNPVPVERKPKPVEVVNDSTAPVPVEVLGGSGAPVEVTVTNDPGTPISVQSTLSGEPFSVWEQYTWEEGEGFFSAFDLTVVPDGKIFVIEFVTMNFTIGYEDNLVRPRIEVGPFGLATKYHIKCDRMTPDGKVAYLDREPHFGHWTATETVKIYARGSVSIHAQRETPTGPAASGAVNVTLSGYLIDG